MKKHLLKIMDKRVVNEKQFRKLVINEANKVISEEEKKAPITKRKITFDKVESLIKEMKKSNKSIASITTDSISDESEEIVKEEKYKPNRDLNVIEHNKKKNIIHVNENEKDKWNRMLNYEVPSDEER